MLRFFLRPLVCEEVTLPQETVCALCGAERVAGGTEDHCDVCGVPCRVEHTRRRDDPVRDQVLTPFQYIMVRTCTCPRIVLLCL